MGACVCVPVCMHVCAGMLMCECACRLCMDTLYMQKMVEGKTVVGSSCLIGKYVCMYVQDLSRSCLYKSGVSGYGMDACTSAHVHTYVCMSTHALFVLSVQVSTLQ